MTGGDTTRENLVRDEVYRGRQTLSPRKGWKRKDSIRYFLSSLGLKYLISLRNLDYSS